MGLTSTADWVTFPEVGFAAPAGRPRGDVRRQLATRVWGAEGGSEAPAQGCGRGLGAGTRQEQPAGRKKGQEDDGEQGGGRQSKASVAGAARTARRPSVRPSRLGESGFCAGDSSRRSGDRKRSRCFPGVWLGRGERGDGMTPGRRGFCTPSPHPTGQA